jgi:tetratricopeptide (TPR) repeat protein
VVLALFVLMAITAAACTFGRRWRYLLVGWFWYLGTMVPVVGLIHVGAQSMADRYAYVPFWGLWMIAVWGARDLWLASARSTAARYATIACSAALAAGLGFLTYGQAAKWHDTITLFEDAVADTQRNWKAHRLLADQYLIRGDYQRSLEHCERGIDCGRELGRLLSTQGRALFDSGAREQAITKLRQATDVEPEDSLIRTNLGWAYTELGQFGLAREQFERAAALLPESATPYARQTLYANWGFALAKSGKLREAREKFATALEATPNDSTVLRGAGEVELQLGEAQRALNLLRPIHPPRRQNNVSHGASTGRGG